MTSSVSPETEQMIKKAFDLQRIGTGPHSEVKDGKIADFKFGVNYLWLIELKLHNKFFTLACVQKVSEKLGQSSGEIKVYRDELEYYKNEQEYYNEGILLPIEIHSKVYHPIVDELSVVKLPESLSLEKEMQHVSILPTGNTFNLEHIPNFKIVTITSKAIVTYRFAGIHEHESTENLESAIFKTFRFLLKEHNHPVLNKLAKPDYGY